MQLKTALSILPLAITAIVCSCNNKPYPVYFHTQAEGIEEGARKVFMHGGSAYTRMPIFTHFNFKKFRSFMAEDGSYGIELFLKDEYRLRLEHLCYEFQGKKMLPVINGLVFEPQWIKGVVTDGTLVIWSGLNGYDLKQIAKTIDPVDPKMEKARFKDKNPRPLPQRPKEQSKLRDHTGRVIGELYQN